MRGNVYRPGRRRTGSIVLAAAALALALAVVLGSAATAFAKAPVPRVRSSVIVAAVSHSPGVRLPIRIAHAAGHKIA